MESDTPGEQTHYLYQALNVSLADCEAVTGERPNLIYLTEDMLTMLDNELRTLPATPIDARLNLTAMTYNGIPIYIQED